MTSIYRAILRQALKIMWSCKYLWFFGIFAIFLTSGGEINSAIDNFYRVSDTSSFLGGLKAFFQAGFLVDLVANFKTFFQTFNSWGTILFILFLLLFLFIVWLAVVSQAGLFGAVYRLYKKQDSSFSDTFAIGRHNFWKTLWLNILNKAVIYVVLFVVALPVVLLYIGNSSETLKNILIVLSFVALVPFSLLVSLLTKYAILFVVNKKYGIKQSISSAWKLFCDNWLVSIEMAIVMFFVNIIAAIILVLAVMALALPLAILVLLLSVVNFSGVMYLTVLLAIILLVVLMLWGGAMLSVLHHTAWTILFIRMSEGKVIAKLIRLIAKKSLPAEQV